jgi:hypothetical protein
MSRKTLLLLLPCLLVSVLALPALLQTPGSAPPSSPGITGTADDGPKAVAAAAAQAVNADAPAPGPETERVEAAVAQSEAPPIPPDAKWVDITVVQAADQKPVPGAEVVWLDDRAFERAIDPTKGALDLSSEERQWLWRDFEATARHWGWRAVTDAHGGVRVHLGEWTQVFARHASDYGKLRLDPGAPRPAGGFRIELQPDLSARVRVLDAAGAPVAKVPVGVQRCDKDGKQIDLWNGALARTEADGTATLPHLQGLLDNRGDDGPPAASFRACVVLGETGEAGVEFDPRTPPAEPLVLHLPPCGKVKMRAELRGRPLPNGGGDFFASITRADGSGRRGFGGGMWRGVDADGWVRFPWVPLGASWNAFYRQGSSWLQHSFAGPSTQGQEVTVAIPVPEDSVLLGGRVLDGKRELLRSTKCNYQLEGAGLGGGGQLQTDDQGRFVVVAGRIRGKDRDKLQRFEVSLRRSEGPPLRAVLGPCDVHPGEQDLGDFVLGEGHLLVAGRLQQGDKPFTKKIALNVERLETNDRGNPREAWRRVRGQMLEWPAPAEFALRGDDPPGRYRLAFPDEGHRPIAPIDFTPGATGLVVQVDPGANLAATLLVPEHLPDGIRGVLVPAAPPAVDAAPKDRQRPDGLTAEASDYNDTKRRQLRWQALPAGSYTLELRLWPASAPLLQISDVIVPPPDDGDPRLLDIDLTQAVEVLKLRFLDVSGAPIQEDTDAIVLPLPAADEGLGHQIWGRSGRIAVRPGPVDLLVAVSGYRPQQLRGVRGEVDVRLEKWPQIELVFPDLPEMQGATVLVRASPVDAQDVGKYRTQWSSGDRAEYLRPNSGSATVEGGRARLTIGDGAHKLDVMVALAGPGSGKRRTLPLPAVSPAQVFAGPAPIAVHLSADAVLKTVEELKNKDKPQGK